MTAPSVLALDVDGTLLTSDHRLTPATRRAVAAARDAGIVVVLASARSPRGLAPLVEALGLDGPMIAFGGGLVYEPGGAVLHERRLRVADARAIALDAASLGVEVGWYAGDRWLVDAVGPGIAREARITGETPELACGERPPPHKLLCIGPGPALHALRDRVPGSARGQLSHHEYLEVTAAGVDKGRALAAVLDRLGVAAGRAAAIGDGENDAGLLRLVGRGIAMGHAPAAVRAAADGLTDTNDRDGVAQAIDALLGVRSRAP